MFDPLTLDQMRVLVAVAESGSFSAAARRLGRVQSAISQSMQTMEATLGVTLFDRSTRTPALTDAGLAIVKDARAMLESAKAMRARAESIAEDVEPELTLAVDSMFPMPLLMASLDACAANSPNCRRPCSPRRSAAPSNGCATARRGWRSTPCRGGAPRDLSTLFLTRIALTPVVAAGHPLAAVARPARPRSAGAARPARADRPHRLTQNMQGGVVASRIWRFADLSTRLEFLLAGFGWCNMPLHMVEGHIAAGRLKRLAIAGSPESNCRSMSFTSAAAGSAAPAAG